MALAANDAAVAIGMHVTSTSVWINAEATDAELNLKVMMESGRVNFCYLGMSFTARGEKSFFEKSLLTSLS
jgi:hypothetical protein